MDAEQRLTEAIIKAAYTESVKKGNAYFFDDTIEALAEEVVATPQQTRQVMREMRNDYLLFEQQPRYYRATERLALVYEETDRAAAYRQNEIRRWILEQVGEIDANAQSEGLVQFRADDTDPYPRGEQLLAARVLGYTSFLDMREEGHMPFFQVRLGERGYDALRDESILRRELPINVTDDEEAQVVVTPDALREIIISCEQMLGTLGWKQALVELGRGDKAYREENWVEAVREYYAALESGLKYALGIDDETVEESNRALHKLAGRTAKAGLIPVNYQAVFGFADSIRSPRSHGGGRRAERVGEVEVGQAEALLMGNHTRTLLLYLGQRASVHRAATS